MPIKRPSAATRLDEARARMYRELIFETAESVFAKWGFEGATMQEIAAEAGVSLKTVYASFPGKSELYLEIMESRSQAMYGAAADALRSIDSPIEKLERRTRAILEYMFTHAAWRAIHLRSCAPLHAPARSHRPARSHEANIERLRRAEIDACTEIIREGIVRGEFFDEDPGEMASLIRALTDSHVARAHEAGEADPIRIGDRLIEKLHRLVCKPNHAIRAIAVQETA